MAPAANDRRYGIAGTAYFNNAIVARPASGSTAPESVPSRNALFFVSPFILSGMEIIAPSGKFWIAMPSDRARAAATLIREVPDSRPA